MNKIRIVIADDERPARLFLKAILQDIENVDVVGEAENGTEAIELIRSLKPDLALLDLQMPEASGIDVVRILRKSQMPLVAFVTAYDDYAIQAFELNAIDYLLKPIEKARLLETLQRAQERLEHTDHRQVETDKLKTVAADFPDNSKQTYIERIPVKRRDEITLVSVSDVVSIVADGELLHLTNVQNKRFTINHRLKDLEARIEPNKFIRLSRGALVNLEMISRISPMPGGTYLVNLKNGQQLSSSRLQSRILREKFLKL